MITEQEIQLNIIQSYDEYYGLTWNQVALINTSLEKGYLKNKNVEKVLDIFKFHQLSDEAYLDDDKTWINLDYITKNPQIVEKHIEKHYRND